MITLNFYFGFLAIAKICFPYEFINLAKIHLYQEAPSFKLIIYFLNFAFKWIALVHYVFVIGSVNRKQHKNNNKQKKKGYTTYLISAPFLNL